MGTTPSTLPTPTQVKNLAQLGGIQHMYFFHKQSCITYHHSTSAISHLYDYDKNKQNHKKQNKIYITNDATLGILRSGMFCLLDYDFQINMNQKKFINNISYNQVQKVIGRFKQYDNCYMFLPCLAKQIDQAWLVVSSLPVNFFPIKIGQTIRLGNIDINIQAILHQSKDQNKDTNHESTQSSEACSKPDSSINLQIPQCSQSYNLSFDSFKTLSIGSSPQCNIYLPYPTIQSVHCQLTYHKEMNSILISDLNSQFGTLIKVDKEIIVSIQNNGVQVQVGNNLIEMNVKRKQAQYQSPTYQQINRVFVKQSYKQQRFNKFI